MKQEKLCEACQSNLATVIETRDHPEHPYHLCEECHERLTAKALRPIEWYRLAVMYSPHPYYLMDEFYSDDGEAIRPEREVESGDEFLAPTLEDVQDDLESLIDYALTKWYLERDTVDAFHHHSLKDLQTSLKKRFKQTPFPQVKQRLLEIAADVLGPVASSWIRQLWKKEGDVLMYSLAYASSQCLPEEEGVDKVVTALTTIDEDLRPRAALEMLAEFRSPFVLDWLEDNCETSDPHWGALASTCYPTWDRMKDWLAQGRPLSLVALDTMDHSREEDGDPLFAQYYSVIEDTVLSEVEPTLLAYLQQDPAPEVKAKVEAILALQHEIFE